MVFSSLVFLLVFFPAVIALNYVCPAKFRNVFLLLASLLFYSWGAMNSIVIFAASIAANYFFALALDKTKEKAGLCKFIMILMLVANISLLFAFKYLSTAIDLINHLPKVNLSAPKWSLPLGISFFTFSAISYCLDVYFQACPAEKNFLNVALYISFFPKLISGPIVQWQTFKPQLENRKFDADNFAEGLKRFVFGLFKKAVIADTIGGFCDFVFTKHDFSNVSVVLGWFAVLSYLIQLYYDFSGYSDMAVGLGKMLGFELDENFDHPFVSKNIVEFWTRWHITLGTWLKHYIYTPVFRGLSKKKNPRTGKKLKTKTCDYISLLVSWCIIGPWHGAGLSYLIYGLWFCFFIILERIFDNYKKQRSKAGKPIKGNFFTEKILPHFYAIFVVALGMMIFRSISTKNALRLGLALFGLEENTFFSASDLLYLTQYAIIFVLGAVLSLPVVPFLERKLKAKSSFAYEFISLLGILLLFVISLSFVVGSTYTAFIYFNF